MFAFPDYKIFPTLLVVFRIDNRRIELSFRYVPKFLTILTNNRLITSNLNFQLFLALTIQMGGLLPWKL